MGFSRTSLTDARWNVQTEERWSIGDPVFESDEICVHHRVWPWNGHRLFGYDLVRFLRPERVVELGTYWGTSFFSFCQAAKDSGLGTELIAIDTWAGDDHTGEYGGDAYENVQNTVQTCFPGQNIQMIRKLFLEALTSINDNSVDVLHIDGCHHYEAVRQDYETWLPKVKENGVVLLHDIAESCDYGSVRFWNELKRSYPSFTFQHSWGLGVLFPKGDLVFKALLQNNFEDKLLVYENRSELNLMRILKDAHEERGDKQDTLIKHQEKVIADLSQKCDVLEQRVKESAGSRICRVLRKVGVLPEVKI